MDNLNISKTESSLEVLLDSNKNIISFEGESRPENCQVFFEPILKWVVNYRNYLYYKINEFNTKDINIEVIFRLDYFNSTSAKYILDIFLELKELKKQNPSVNIEIKWYYKAIDEDMKECGEEFIAMSELPINLIAN